ncbi:MAG: T9SS type A sorting domain-containing protein [Bacteroidales bacterium]
MKSNLSLNSLQQDLVSWQRIACILLVCFICNSSYGQNSGSKSFLNTRSDWVKIYNQKNGNVQRAYGKPIAIEGFSSINIDNVLDAAYAFIAQNQSAFPVSKDQLVLKSKYSAQGKFYVFFKQVVNHKEIYDSELFLLISKSAKVMALGNNCFDVKNNCIVQKERFSPQQLRSSVNSLYNTRGTTTRVDDGGFYLTKVVGDQVYLVPSYKVNVQNRSRNQQNTLLINASDQSVLHNISGVFDFDTKVKGTVKPENVTQTSVALPLSYMKITVNGTEYTTDAKGSITGLPDADNYTYSGEFTGLYSNVVNENNFTGSVTSANASNFTLTDEATASARNVFYHQTKAHDFITKLDPNFTGMNLALPTTVNDNSYTCNAFYSRRTSETGLGNFTFCVAGKVEGESFSCRDFSLSPEVIYHEYGHACNDYLFFQLNNKDGMLNSTCHEGTADFFAALITHNPIVGKLLYVGQEAYHIRNLKNTKRFPEDDNGEPHYSGQIISGAFWDLKDLTSFETAQRIFHFAHYAQPDDFNNRLAFSEWFIAALIADDHDDDLTTPSPNKAAIIQAFNNHGIGTDLYMKTSFTHTVLPNTDNTSSSYRGTFTLAPKTGKLADGKVKVYYSTDNFATKHALQPTFADGVYSFDIPAQAAGSFVKYYFEATDSNTNTTMKFPEGSPTSAEPYKFLVGYTTVLSDNFETNKGWVFNNKETSKIGGPWNICTPQRSVMSDNNTEIETQPGSGYNDGSGTKCLVTGCLKEQQYSSGDVVLSPVFDCSSYQNIAVSFFCNFFSHKGEGSFSFYVSGNGGANWHLIETIQGKPFSWKQFFFNVKDYVQDAASLQFKFVTSEDNHRLMNVLIDNFEIQAYSSTTGVKNVNKQLSSVSVFPNPVKDVVKVNINALKRSNVTASIYDLHGRKVKDVYNGEMPQGEMLLDVNVADIQQNIFFLKVNINGEREQHFKIIKQ